MGPVEDARLETIKRRSDDPKLAIGDTVVLNDGHRGVVLARYIPSAHQDEVRYVVEIQSDKHPKRKQ